MNRVSRILRILLSMLLALSIASCSSKDPEIKDINEQYSLLTMDGKVALLKYNENDSDEVIFCENFVAYTVIDNFLVLCEEPNESIQIFWIYDLEIGSYNCYDSYNSLLSALDFDDLNWTKLWVKEFSIK